MLQSPIILPPIQHRIIESSVLTGGTAHVKQTDEAMDDDVFTRWATNAGTQQARLEVDLGKPTTFNRTRICEEFDRVREFELQYKDGSEWRTFARGGRIGRDYSRQFESATTRYVRLNILKATDGPTIWEFQLFAPKK